jgi:hypothetical protein
METSGFERLRDIVGVHVEGRIDVVGLEVSGKHQSRMLWVTVSKVSEHFEPRAVWQSKVDNKRTNLGICCKRQVCLINAPHVNRDTICLQHTGDATS